MVYQTSDRHSHVVLAVAFSVVGIAALFAALLLTPHGPVQHIYKNIMIGPDTFNITALALNETQWLHGLMDTSITNSTLMLFEFNQTADYPFWMYDTYANLDMVWINYSYSSGSGKVVYIARNATSCFVASKCQVYDPQKAANFVLEAKAGFASRNNISAGDRVALK